MTKGNYSGRRILIIGDGHAEIHEQACAEALRSLGYDVSELYWSSLFRSEPGIGKRLSRSLSRRIQNRVVAGPAIIAFNKRVEEHVEHTAPDMVLVYRGTHVLPRTLQAIRRRHPDAILASFNNDDPFSDGADWLTWRHFLKAVPAYDIHFVYRHHNVDDFMSAGARHVRLLRSYYIPNRNFPLAELPMGAQSLGSDVVFAGHFEPDERIAALRALVDNAVAVRLFGPGWEDVTRRGAPLQALAPVRYLEREQYNVALNATKIALSFLSTLNRDTYTRRSFEIPASGTFMLSQYTPDLATLFEEGREVEFFRTPAELVLKTKYYLEHDHERREIAQRGLERVRRDSHDVVSRMREMIKAIAEYELRFAEDPACA